jgi:SAM-dependent methyltransferase
MDHKQTAEHWAEQYQSKIFARREWIGHPLAAARLQRIMSGHSTHSRWFVETQMKNKPVKRGLGVGVGVAFHELQLMESGAVRFFDFYDVSQAGLDIARNSATEMGVTDRIHFVCADINNATLPDNTYDVITFMASLHHIERLQETLKQCEKALAPEGILWAFEYVGPDRFQYPDEHADIAKLIYKVLDPDMRLPGEPDLKFPSPEDVIAVDPTEAIHSSEILSTMTSIWPSLEVYGQYGSLLFMLMWCLDYNAIYDNPKCFQMYGTLVELETKLVDRGALPHYFVNAVARKHGQNVSSSFRKPVRESLLSRLLFSRRNPKLVEKRGPRGNEG